MEKVARFLFVKAAKIGRINHKFSIFNFSRKLRDPAAAGQFSMVFLVCILIIAAFLRLYRIEDYITFLGDEGRDVLVVYNILHGKFTLLGPTASVGGFFLGPIYYYFMAPFLWLFNYNPVGPAVMVALFGIATVYLVYKVGSEFFNRNVGLIAAILYAISPLVIAYSRSSWNPNLMPFFSLSTLYVLYKALNKNNVKLLLLSGFLLGITMQLHYLTLFLAVIITVYIFLIRRSFQKAFKYYIFILIGFIIGWSPFLAFEVRHGFPNIQSILSFVFAAKDTGVSSNFFATIYNVFFRLFGRLVTHFPPPEQVAIGAHKNIALWYYTTLALGIASLVAVSRSKNNPGKTLVITWFILGVGLFGFYKKPIYDYYFGFMFPLPFLLVGLFLSYLLKRKIGILMGIIIFIVLGWLNLQGIPFRFPANRQLAQAQQISKFVLSKTNNMPYNFGLISGGNSDHAYRYFFMLWGKSPVAIKTLQDDPARESVTDQLLVVCERNPCQPLGDPAWEVAGFGRGEIVESWDVSVVKVYKLKHYIGKP